MFTFHLAYLGDPELNSLLQILKKQADITLGNARLKAF